MASDGAPRRGPWWRHVVGIALVAASVATAVGAAQRAPVQSDQEILVELERNWNDAFYRKDVDFIANVLADDFVATYDDGTLGDKARELSLVESFNQQVESAIQTDFTVKIYRDSAVVWFTLRLVGIRQGERAEVALRYTDVFVWRDDRWQCVSSQSTKVAAPA